MEGVIFKMFAKQLNNISYKRVYKNVTNEYNNFLQELLKQTLVLDVTHVGRYT